MASKLNLGGREISAKSTQRPFSAVYPCTNSPHQRRWSEDFNNTMSSAVITVRKSKKEPKPPQRSTSLQRPHIKAYCSSKRYSCPALGILSPPNSSSPPPAVQTSSITGPDPSGWKIRPKSGNTSSQSARLSLQIPISEKIQSCQSSNQTKHSKLPRRRYSDSWAFLRCLGAPLHVTSEELSAVNLHHINNLSDTDDVFCEKPTKEAPPVPVKTEMARQIAQLIAFSQELSMSNEDDPIRKF